MTIGQNIRIFRMRRNLSLAQLGQMIGMTGATIGSYERGTILPKRRVVEKLAHALEVPAEKIMEETPSPLIENRKYQETSASDRMLYNGVLTAMKELYSLVEGRIIVGENGNSKKYYLIHHPTGSFVLYEKDIDAIVRSTKASLPPLVEYMQKMHSSKAVSGGNRV